MREKIENRREYKVQIRITKIRNGEKSENTIPKIILRSRRKWYLSKVSEESNTITECALVKIKCVG